MSTNATRAPQADPTARGQEPAGRSRGLRSGLAGLLELPRQAVRRVVQLVRATPGRLSVIAVGLVVLSVVTGAVGTAMVQDRKDTINGLIDHREPLAAAAQQVYRSLSDADATAASGFLATGAEPSELRQRYELDVAQAGAALAKAASDSAGVGEAAEQVDILGKQLPVYTGLVETARANNRQGFPAGASYLREASELMRAQLLPAAQDLYRIDTERLAEEQEDATGFPWLTTLLVLGLLAALIATQVYLTHKANRVVNVGLLVATAAVAVAVLWGSVALIVQSALVSGGQQEGTQQVDVLVRARIAALQARADETLTLVARGDGGDYEEEFARLSIELLGEGGNGGLLAEAQGVASEQDSAENVGAAIRNAEAWFATHENVRALDDGGDYSAAVDVATNPNMRDGAAPAVRRLDENLAAAIDVGRQGFLDDTVNADRALTLLAPGFAVLAVIAAAGATVGIRERLREYR